MCFKKALNHISILLMCLLQYFFFMFFEFGRKLFELIPNFSMVTITTVYLGCVYFTSKLKV